MVGRGRPRRADARGLRADLARAAGGTVVLTAGTAADVAAICRRLDGLAVETKVPAGLDLGLWSPRTTAGDPRPEKLHITETPGGSTA